MTTTPTSGAADRAIESCPELNMGNYDEVDVERLNDWAIRANDEIDRLHALAAGQATAAPAEPDPTPGDHPQPCDSELFESGVSVGLFDIPQWTAEALCKGIAAATGARVDWHYIGGRVHVKALPAPTSAEGVAYAALPTSSHAGRVYEEGFLIGACPLYTADQMRSFADATYMLRASHGQAPAWAAQADSEQEEEAARLDWLEQHDGRYYNLDKVASIVGTGFLVQSEGNMPQVHSTLRGAVDTARKQGANHD